MANDFWKLDHLTTDRLNADIWEQSPGLQRQIQPPRSLLSEGAIGAQQAMIDDAPDGVLPWVPDLIGKDWQDENSILIVGSAYAGFIAEYSGRGASTHGASMPLSSYSEEQTSEEFQHKFFDRVVIPDRSYYGRISFVLPQNWDASKIALFDLCRASFVQRANRMELKANDAQGDKVVRKAPQVFDEYTMKGLAAEWTWQRIIRSKAHRIVALGTVAEHGLLRLFASRGMQAFVECQPQIQYGPGQFTKSVTWPLRYAGRHDGEGWQLADWYSTDSFWIIKGDVAGEERTWYMRPTNHPSDRSLKARPSAAATRSALAAMEQAIAKVV